MTDPFTDLAIIGAGAGGLMGAVMAAQAGIRCVLIERKPQPGRKLLMCANNRCNLTNDLAADDMIAAYGAPVGDFLTPAITGLSPRALCQWFAANGLKTRTHKDGKVFPHSEKSTDVIRFFSGQLRDHNVPVMYNAPVEAIERLPDGFLVVCACFTLRARTILLATGGVSYPKTGSVGDGQKIARSLGHKITPYRPGLVGWDVAERWLTTAGQGALPGAKVTIYAGETCVGATTGEIEYSHQGIRGPAVIDASRLMARHGGSEFRLEVDLFPRWSENELTDQLERGLGANAGSVAKTLAGRMLSPPFVRGFFKHASLRENASSATVSAALKHWLLTPVKSRPLKEAMVTVGGVSLAEVNPGTMGSKLVPGLYFCGEVLDIDGPTGGFNLHAAFATATLAARAVAAGTEGKKKPPRNPRRDKGGKKKF
ncbi:MAG: aminoacetone oxidase family FAD-binding enzyme [Lentisphaeria bacterium]|nr:aminoacetone oxidase family FAD-binding enzyme [Lentisphaeria bacterium]